MYWGRPKRIYADYAAGAPVSPVAAAAYRRALSQFGNPSSLHAEGRAAAALLSDARADVASFLNVTQSEVVFTASGSEANTLAIAGAIEAAARVRGGLSRVAAVTSAIEHPSVLRTFAAYEERGVLVSYARPDATGIVTPDTVSSLVSPETALVSIHHGNSELGIIQPIADIFRAVRAIAPQAVLHVDACQSAPWLPTHLDTLRADMLSIDGAKVGSVRGIAALAVSSSVALEPVIRGGGQEGGMRAGTESVAAAAAFAAALRDVRASRAASAARVTALRDELASRIASTVSDTVLNGHRTRRLPHIVNVSARRAPAELVVVKLDTLGVAASPGTACAASDGPSPGVLSVYPGELWRAETAVRFSLSPTASSADVRAIAAAYAAAVAYARAASEGAR